MLLRNLFESLDRTGQGKSAVVGWGRGMGHKGHMFLASAVITQARETDADPYFVVSNTVGKDDPITPEEKLAIYKKVFPQSGHIFQSATDEMPGLIHVLTKLQNMGYTDVIVVVGADQVKAMQFVTNYNGKPDKSGNILFTFDSLKVISRQETSDPSAGEEGPRATPMRDVLKDPSKSEEEKFAIWRDAMSPELSDDEVRDLMNKAGGRMAAMAVPKPKKVKAVAEAEGEPEGVKHISKELLTHIVQQVGTEGAHAIVKSLQWGDGAAKELLQLITKDLKQDIASMKEQAVVESTSLPTTLTAIINDISEPIASVYDTMQFQAKKYFEGHGEINRGFNMVAAGVGGRWVQNLYFRKLQNELYDLCKYNPKRTVELQQFLRGYEDDKGELEMSRSFKNISNDLPTILIKIGNYLESPQLSKAAHRWIEKRDAYYAYLDTLVDDDDDYDEPEKIKPEKSRVVGQQNAQVDQIVNGVLAKLPKNVAGDIRNAIARSANKLQALHQELQKRNIQGVAERMMPASNFAGSKKNKLGPAGQWKNTGPSKNRPARAGDLVGGDAQESIGSKLAGLGLAGAMALGGHAQAADLSNFNTQYLQQVVSGEHPRPMVNIDDAKAELQARANGKQQTVSPAASNANSGFSKGWLQKAADPNRNGRYLISVEKAQELLNKMNAVDEAKIKGADGKACWDGYKYAGTENGKDKCVPISENVENIIDSLINKIIVNEAIPNNKR